MDPVNKILEKKKCDKCGGTKDVWGILLGTTNLCAKCRYEDDEMLF